MPTRCWPCGSTSTAPRRCSTARVRGREGWGQGQGVAASTLHARCPASCTRWLQLSCANKRFHVPAPRCAMLYSAAPRRTHRRPSGVGPGRQPAGAAGAAVGRRGERGAGGLTPHLLLQQVRLVWRHAWNRPRFFAFVLPAHYPRSHRPTSRRCTTPSSCAAGSTR